MVEYITPEETKDLPLWWHRQGLSFTASGYGKAIPSPTVIRLSGEKRWRRVYVTRYSNVGSAWIKVQGRKLFIA